VKPIKVDHHFISKVEELRAAGWKQDQIAVELGVAQGTVSIICRGRHATQVRQRQAHDFEQHLGDGSLRASTGAGRGGSIEKG
jgi:transcriptional regulator with XRE-family HTH domain